MSSARGALALGFWLLAALGGPGTARAAHVNVVTLAGTINPASSDFLQRVIAQTEEEGAEALIIELDTPGGLVASTKDIIQAMLNATVPLVVYVAPQGAWAGSAGTFITLAGHVAAMAPGTSIGAAHPVGVGGGSRRSDDEEEKSRDIAGEKAENLLAAFIESIAKERGRNVEWAVKAVRESVAIAADEALELHVIDLMAANRAELLKKLEGRSVKVAGEERVLKLSGAAVRSIEMPLFTRFLHILANPDIAVLLILAGLLGLYTEFNHPGLLLPGIAGAVCLILGFIALQVLPFSWLGLLLLLGGLALFVTEIFVTSYGALFLLGTVCILLGGSMLFDLPEVSDLTVSFWPVLVPAVAAFATFGGLVIYAVGRTLRRAQAAGVGELIGMVGRTHTRLGPEGTVFVRGEYWTARAEEEVPADERVEVTGVEGLRLRVRRARPER
jgi:membrane-bound serine protease (ClpP class)